MYESLFKLVQACTNSGSICIGSLQIEQACTNSRTACMGYRTKSVALNADGTS